MGKKENKEEQDKLKFENELKKIKFERSMMVCSFRRASRKYHRKLNHNFWIM